MIIDIENDNLLTLSQAAKLLPHAPSPSTIWRWYRRGVGGRRLSVVKIGARTYTTWRALSEFARFEGDNDSAPTIRSTAERERAIRAAETELTDAEI
ncbi:MAG: DUF1580 domain-containing protein [Planctomycetia bacterium]|nr:DUF1580 domain-containing protein [Planctomycetia bacterium]